MNLVGYLNRSRTYPSPLISVGKEGRDFFAFFPSGDKVKLLNVESQNALEQRDSFVPPMPAAPPQIPKLAFGVRPELIISGDERAVGRLLRSYMDAEKQRLRSDEADVIRTFLLSINEVVGGINAQELKDWLQGKARLKAYLTTRQLRRQNTSAARLVVQLERRNATRTLYRKGIPCGKNLSDVRIPVGAVASLQRSLF